MPPNFYLLSILHEFFATLKRQGNHIPTDQTQQKSLVFVLKRMTLDPSMNSGKTVSIFQPNLFDHLVRLIRL